jgi:hypothetical protein
MAELKEVVAEAAEDVAAEALELAATSRALQGKSLSIGIAAGLVVGVTATYFITRKLLETKYEKLANSEIDQMREHFRKRALAKEPKPELSDIGRVTEPYKGNSDIPMPVIPESIKPNVPVPPRGRTVEHGWDYEVEKALRSEDRPYIIHVDERHEREDYEEITLTYYAGDDILCDHEDKIVDDQDRVVGLTNLDKFGHGSDSKDVVYIRNEYLTLDIEVCRSDKSYAEEVSGFKHSDTRRRRKVQWDE